MALAFVLHSHLPYCRGAGRWPHGEEWLHEAILGTYVPLLVLLFDLRSQGVPFQISVGITPILLEQFVDPDIDRRFLEYVDDQIRRAEADTALFADAGSSSRAALAAFYADSYRKARDSYVRLFSRDLAGAFADLHRTGHLELLTSAATHGYLPLLDDASVEAQLSIGASSTRRLLGVEATGIWLPECAYAPGVERRLEAHGLTHFFTDASLVAQGGPGTPAQRPGWQRSGERSGEGLSLPRVGVGGELLEPYYVGDTRVAAVARHQAISGQVWSAAVGYPGDPFYREFHRKDDQSGIRYWRVTDTTVGLGEKAEYSVGAAAGRVREHAAHFLGLVAGELARHEATMGGEGLLAATFDSELFGHWWFEGIDWLGLVLRGAAERGIALTSVAAYLGRRPPRERIALREGSWGKQNDHSTWLNADTRWMWDELAARAATLVALDASPPSDALRARAARQAARELLLAQASDWPFLATTGQAVDYAIERFNSHVQRFDRAAALAESGTRDDEAELRTLERADNPFVDADPAAFAPPSRFEALGARTG
ncbi:MAG: 1,4-alpha-glucan branching protein domain-containing protein [Candidatus Limnocylindria bacterium]